MQNSDDAWQRLMRGLNEILGHKRHMAAEENGVS